MFESLPHSLGLNIVQFPVDEARHSRMMRPGKGLGWVGQRCLYGRNAVSMFGSSNLPIDLQ
jgi:hypothetical protein